MSEKEKMNVNTAPAVDTSTGTAEDVEAIMKKYDRESNTRIWEGVPKKVVRYLLAAFAGGIAVSMTVVWFVLGRHSRKTETEKKSEKPVSVAKAVRGNDLRAVRDNVLAWARKAFPDAEVRNLDDVAALADDRAFAGELQKLQKALYSGRGEDYNPAAFMEAFAAADKRRAKRKKGDERLLPGLYE